MTPFAHALETSVFLAEKIASTRSVNPSLQEKLALADFAAFGLFKQAAFDPAALSSLQRGLGWGVGLGIPALAAGHMFLNDARSHSGEVLRDARNQALMTAAGVGGMQALGEMFKKKPHPVQHNVNVSMPPGQQEPLEAPIDPPQLDTPQKLAAAIMVDDVLEAACSQLIDPEAKHAALVQLIKHRSEATSLLRSLLP